GVTVHGAAIGITEHSLTAPLPACGSVLMRDADALGHGVARNGFLQKARAWRTAPDRTVPVAVPDLHQAQPVTAEASATTPGAKTLSAAARTAQAVAETQRLVADSTPALDRE